MANGTNRKSQSKLKLLSPERRSRKSIRRLLLMGSSKYGLTSCVGVFRKGNRKRKSTPPVTPWEFVTPEVSDPTARRELPKVG